MDIVEPQIQCVCGKVHITATRQEAQLLKLISESFAAEARGKK